MWGAAQGGGQGTKRPGGGATCLGQQAGCKQAAAGALEERLWWLLLETRVVEEGLWGQEDAQEGGEGDGREVELPAVV